MSRCDLSINLEDRGLVRHPGEVLRGEVAVEVNSACACRKLTLTCAWRAHGRGNRTEGVKGETVLFQGEWQPGMPQRYPFEIPVPSGLATYHGKLLNVDWVLRARADIPWAIDPKAEADFLLEVPDGGDYDFGPGYRPPAEAYKASEKGLGCKIAFGGVFVLIGAVVMAAFAAVHVIPLLVGAFFVFIGLMVILGMLWRGIAQKKLGIPEVRIGTSVARPGLKIPVFVGIKPRAAVKLEGVTAELRATEVVVSGSGTNRTTHRQVLHQAKATLDVGGREVGPGEAMDLEGELEVPPGAPPTFSAPDNELRWEIVIHIGIAGWPDWKREYPLSVRP